MRVSDNFGACGCQTISATSVLGAPASFSAPASSCSLTLFFEADAEPPSDMETHSRNAEEGKPKTIDVALALSAR